MIIYILLNLTIFIQNTNILTATYLTSDFPKTCTELKVIFKKYDSDKSGYIQEDELP